MVMGYWMLCHWRCHSLPIGSNNATAACRGDFEAGCDDDQLDSSLIDALTSGLRPRLHDENIVPDERPLNILGAPKGILQSNAHLGQLPAHLSPPLLVCRQRLRSHRAAASARPKIGVGTSRTTLEAGEHG